MTLAGSSRSPHRSGRAKSCTACRQVKLACDARVRPGPCTRCVQRDLPCRFDAQFRRIETRKIIREIIRGHPDELEAQRAAGIRAQRVAGTEALPPTEDSSISKASVPIPTCDPRSIPTTEIEPAIVVNQDPTTISTHPWLHIDDTCEIHAATLQDVVVQPDDILYLFKHFAIQYYRFIPVFRPLKNIDQLQETSPLLFWTIIITAARDDPAQHELLDQLRRPFEQVIVPKLLQTSIQTVEDIHALLTLCLWPITKNKVGQDPSWSYCGIAINAAQTLGLRHPITPTGRSRTWRGFGDFSPSDFDSKTRVLTWLACFVNGIRLSNYLGTMPPLSGLGQLRDIKKILGEYAHFIPQSFGAAVEMAHVAASSASVLGHVHDQTTCLSLTATFTAELDDIKRRYRSSWSCELETELLATRLVIQGINFTHGSATECQRITDLAAPDPEGVVASSSDKLEVLKAERLLLHQCFETALLLIKSATESNNAVLQARLHPLTHSNGILTFFPNYWWMGVYFAVAFIFKFLCLTDTSDAEQARAVNAILGMHRIISTFTNDQDLVRSAMNIDTMVKLIISGDHKSEKYTIPAVTDHLGASVLYDALFKAALYHNEGVGSHDGGLPASYNMRGDASSSASAPEQSWNKNRTATPNQIEQRESDTEAAIPEEPNARPRFAKGHPLAWPIVGGGNPGRPLIHGILGGEWKWDSQDDVEFARYSTM